VALLVTGVGYIGSVLLRRLAQAEGQSGREHLVGLESFYCSAADQVQRALPAEARLLQGDVANATDVARAFEAAGEPVTTVFHLAAQPSAAVAAREPELTERSNLTGARVVLEAAREHGAQVVFGSSFRVYGDDLHGREVDEGTPYGRVGDLSHLSKVYVEQLARMVGVPFIGVRLGVTYGLGPVMKTIPTFMTVPNLFCQRAMTDEPLRVLEDRPMAFIHVEDAADALVAAARRLQRPGRSGWQVVNAAPNVMTIGQVARCVQRLVEARGRTARIEAPMLADTAFRVRSKLEDEDGWRPRRTMADGLPAVLDWFGQRAATTP
jgi:nucleoside-diphosphate-sugar epimerase